VHRTGRAEGDDDKDDDQEFEAGPHDGVLWQATRHRRALAFADRTRISDAIR
jgi:hypothetical protein